MPKVDVYDIKGKKVSDVELADSVFGIEPNETIVHTVLINYLANQRQGTQSTKNADQSALLEKYKSFIVRSKNLVDEARIIIDSKKSEEENLFAIFFGNSRLGGAELFILSMTWRVAQTILNIAHYGYPKD